MAVRWAAAIAVLLLWLPVAAAQDTGGSFGGGDFGGGSSGGGGGGGDSYSGSSYDSGGYSSSSSSGGGSAGDASAAGILGVLVFGGAIVLLIASTRGGGRLRRAPDEVDDEIDVSAIALGIDWRARRELQARFADLAASGDVKTREGRVRLLRETSLLLRRCEQSWLYAGVVNHSLASRSTAEASFRRAAADARALRQLLSNLSSMVAHQLSALEVVWSPAAEDDRMSTAELETLYPDLKKIDDTSVAGRVFCTYCAGPFAAELLKCPHCGAALERRAPG